MAAVPMVDGSNPDWVEPLAKVCPSALSMALAS